MDENESTIIFRSSTGGRVERNASGFVSIGGGVVLIHEMAAEIERLRGLVESAYIDGYTESSIDGGLNEYDELPVITGYAKAQWHVSRSKEALRGGE